MNEVDDELTFWLCHRCLRWFSDLMEDFPCSDGSIM